MRKEFSEELGERCARRVVADDAARKLGAEIGAQKAAQKIEAARTQRTRRAVAEHSRRAGLQLPGTDNPQRLEAQRKLAALMGETEQDELSTAD